MVDSELITLGELFANSNEIIRRMISLSIRADKIFEGRSKGIISEKESKKWLYKSCGDTKLKQQIRRGINEWNKHLWKLPEFVRIRFHEFSNILKGSERELSEIIRLTTDVIRVLNGRKAFTGSQKEAQKEVADLGLLYFNFAIKIISFFEQDLHRILSENLKSIDVGSRVSLTTILSNYKQYERMAYLLAYAGTRFVSYENSTYEKKPKKWCRICFRRAPPGSNYCPLHDTTNEFKTAFRFGKKVHIAMMERNPSLVIEWKQLRRSIREKEGWERELNDQLCLPVIEWKELLINWIKKSPVLERRLSVEDIISTEHWVDVVKYLRTKFENQLERSCHIEAVWSWLKMAENWSEIEDMFISPNDATRRVSKSPVYSIPTEIQIARLCEQEPGISKSEIARKLKMSPQAVGQLIKRKKELKMYFV